MLEPRDQSFGKVYAHIGPWVLYVDMTGEVVGTAREDACEGEEPWLEEVENESF